MRRKTGTVILVFTIIVAMTASFQASATEPFMHTGIFKKNGKWHSTSTIVGNLIITDYDANRRFTLSFLDIFSTKESIYENVTLSSGGPVCGIGSISFITKIEGVEYYFMRCRSGTPVLINLKTGKPAWSERLAGTIHKEEKRQIVAIIKRGFQFYKTKGKKGDTSDGMLRAAIEMAARYKMVGTRVMLEAIEKYDSWDGDIRINVNENYIKGLKTTKNSIVYTVFSSRWHAQDALRLLGFPILGYPSHSFENLQDATKAISPRTRISNLPKIQIGTPAQDVLQLLSSPNIMMHAITEGSYEESKVIWSSAWRYDFFNGDFSIIILWDEKGGVEQVLKVTPGLWRGNEFFSKNADRPLFEYNKMFNGIHLYSKDFPGKVEVVLPVGSSLEKKIGILE